MARGAAATAAGAAIIDGGAIDPVAVEIVPNGSGESPKSVTRGLQRIGRAGHGVGEVSRGRIFPKFRADLLECAVVARRMRDSLIEATVVPRNPLDVLAQQVVAIAAGATTKPKPTKQTTSSIVALLNFIRTDLYYT